MSDEVRKALEDMTGLISPGTVMWVIIHTAEEGVIPPRVEDEQPVGDAHAFGPFVTEDEARQWQHVADQVKPCDCRRAVIELIVPRILAVIGPAGVPIDIAVPGMNDWKN